MYNHFGSKAGIALALSERALAVHEEYVASAWELDASPLSRLLAAGTAALRFSREEPFLFRTLALAYMGSGILGQETGAASERVAGRVEVQIERLTTTLEAAVEAGELRALDAPSTARFLLGSWTGAITMGMRPDAPGRTDAVLLEGTRGLLEGLATGPALTRDGRLRARYLRSVEKLG